MHLQSFCFFPRPSVVQTDEKIMYQNPLVHTRLFISIINLVLVSHFQKQLCNFSCIDDLGERSRDLVELPGETGLTGSFFSNRGGLTGSCEAKIGFGLCNSSWSCILVRDLSGFRLHQRQDLPSLCCSSLVLIN